MRDDTTIYVRRNAARGRVQAVERMNDDARQRGYRVPVPDHIVERLRAELEELEAECRRVDGRTSSAR